MSNFTPEQVERAAEALWFGAGGGSLYGWGNLSGASRQAYLLYAEKILSAAGAPEVTEDMVLRGALALDPEAFADPLVGYGEGAARQSRGDALVRSREVLCAALGQPGAPEKVAPVVDEAALAEVIAPHKMIWAAVSRDAAYCRCGEKYPRNGQPHMEWFELHRAAAVAAYLRGESK